MEVDDRTPLCPGLVDMASPDTHPCSNHNHSQEIPAQSSPSHSTDPHDHMLDHSDSDLTELSDIEMNDEDPSLIGDNKSSNPSSTEDIKLIINKRKPSSSLSEDSDAGSDHEAKPSKKKAKKRSSTAKSSKGKGKLKKNKGKKVVDPDESEEEEVKPKKKVVLAKEVHWKDIPDWGDRTDCPLLQLPADILDMCFGLDTDLGVRDYIALAGVSKYFRDHFTPEIFHSICWFKDVKNIRKRSRWDPEGSSVPKPEFPDLAQHIFSRDVEEWKVEWNKNIYEYGEPAHYIPDGSRGSWSEAQYIVYKEEQAKWRRGVEEARIRSLQDAADHAREAKRKDLLCVRLGNKSRSVLAVVEGRKHGEPPVEKDGRGIPFKRVNDKSSSEENPPANTSRHAEVDANKPVVKRSRFTKSKRWTVPDTDDEQEYKILPERYLRKHEKAVHDGWPNKWRDIAVDWIMHKRINKSEAVNKFKVTDSELLCLSHVLVTNPMSSRTPQQAYLEAAVEALAWRSHGGIDGHEDHLIASAIRSEKLAQSREEKEEKAKREGTYVYKHKKRKIPTYQWIYYRDSFYKDPEWECEYGCEACKRERRDWL